MWGWKFKFGRRSTKEGDEERARLSEGGDLDKDNKECMNAVVRWSVGVKDEFERLARAGRERWTQRDRERGEEYREGIRPVQLASRRDVEADED